MSVRYRKVPQVSDHSDTEDDEAELLNTGQYLHQSFGISTRSECVELDPDPKRQRWPGKGKYILLLWGCVVGFHLEV
jgi:hypothetical protein